MSRDLDLDIFDLLDKPYVNHVMDGVHIGSIETIYINDDAASFDAILSIVTPALYTANDIIEMTPKTKAYLYVDMHDNNTADFSPHWHDIYDFIDLHVQQGHRVLVHCIKGRSRSATAVIYYVMRKKKCSLVEAVQIVKTARPVIRPNSNFVRQLIEQIE